MKKVNPEIDEILTRGMTNIIPNEKGLKKSLLSGKKLNIYLGIDPTATKIHIGHAVLLRKLQKLSELGHNVTFIIGDFTALIGDASDKKSERPMLTQDEIKNNFKTYKKQAEKIVDFSKVKVKYNSEWLKKLNFTDIIKLCQHFSVGDFISRELIKKRLEGGKRVRLDEMLYPVMQGYDSYLLDTDVQIGGADQTFNMQAGRTLQKDLRQKESWVLVTQYLEGTDGRKMSKSWGNAIWIEDESDEMFGKVMSLKDELIINYFTLATDVSSSRIASEKKALENGENPLTVKKRLALQIVKELHNDTKAHLAQEHFENTFQKKTPDFEKEIKSKGSLVDTLANIISSKSEAKRLIRDGAVDVGGKTIKDPTHKVSKGDKIKVGKKIFVRVSSK